MEKLLSCLIIVGFALGVMSATRVTVTKENVKLGNKIIIEDETYICKPYKD